mmetsp:Transcript_43294/g.106924  ORF Transcript_43294/g.106924 Transcript_43294/m.106924 type:complete len:439 (+) Transcript_43294:1354-2670(+)
MRRERARFAVSLAAPRRAHGEGRGRAGARTMGAQARMCTHQPLDKGSDPIALREADRLCAQEHLLAVVLLEISVEESDVALLLSLLPLAGGSNPAVRHVDVGVLLRAQRLLHDPERAVVRGVVQRVTECEHPQCIGGVARVANDLPRDVGVQVLRALVREEAEHRPTPQYPCRVGELRANDGGGRNPLIFGPHHQPRQVDEVEARHVRVLDLEHNFARNAVLVVLLHQRPHLRGGHEDGQERGAPERSASFRDGHAGPCLAGFAAPQTHVDRHARAALLVLGEQWQAAEPLEQGALPRLLLPDDEDPGRREACRFERRGEHVGSGVEHFEHVAQPTESPRVWRRRVRAEREAHRSERHLGRVAEDQYRFTCPIMRQSKAIGRQFLDRCGEPVVERSALVRVRRATRVGVERDGLGDRGAGDRADDVARMLDHGRQQRA